MSDKRQTIVPAGNPLEKFPSGLQKLYLKEYGQAGEILTELTEKNLYCAPVKFAVQPDCRPSAKYFPGDTTVNPGGLQYKTAAQENTMEKSDGGLFMVEPE